MFYYKATIQLCESPFTSSKSSLLYLKKYHADRNVVAIDHDHGYTMAKLGKFLQMINPGTPPGYARVTKLHNQIFCGLKCHFNISWLYVCTVCACVYI